MKKSSINKDEVEQSSCKENMDKGLSPDKNSKEGETTYHNDDEVEEFDDSQNGEEMEEVADAQDLLMINLIMIVFQ